MKIALKKARRTSRSVVSKGTIRQRGEDNNRGARGGGEATDVASEPKKGIRRRFGPLVYIEQENL